MKIKNPIRVIFIIFFILSGFSTALKAQNAPQSPSAESLSVKVLGARVSSTPERARLVIELNKKSQFAFSSLILKDGSKQIAIDVRAAKIEFSGDVSLFGTGKISSVFMEQVEKNRVRTWLTLNSPTQVQQAYVLEPFEEQPARLVVDFIGTNNENFLKNVANDIAFSSGSKVNKSELGDNSNIPGELNLAVTSKPLIVIDPGHGGIDSGARTESNKLEKDIVLDFALELQDLLIKSGRFEVALTRSGDSFLRLTERVEIARLNKADLFISLHADSFEQSNISGTSIYIRDEEATDVLDKILAKNENKSDIVAGFTPPDAKEQVVSILVDLMMRQMRKTSFKVANSIVEQLKPSVEIRRYPIRQADFLVLQAPDVPSILIELGFLSNSTDFKNLSTKEWRKRVSQAITRGVAAHFDGN